MLQDKVKDLIEGIISDLADNKSISDIMLKAQTIAHFLGDEGFKKWISYEQHGYPSVTELPEYRITKCAVNANISNIRGLFKNWTVPVDGLSDETVREALSRMRFLEPISEIEEFAKSKSGDLRMNVPAWTYSVIGELFPHSNVESAWLFTGASTASAIIQQVKSKLLDFFLELDEKLGANIDFQHIKSKGIVSSIMGQTIYNINAAVANTGSGEININDSTINKDTNALSGEAIKRLLQICDNVMATPNVPSELIENAEFAKDELSAPSPNKSRIKMAFNSMGTIASGLATNAIYDLIKLGLSLLQ